MGTNQEPHDAAEIGTSRLGPLSTFGLAQARERARALREKRHDGIDPIEERKATRAVTPAKIVTFDEVSDRWLAAKGVEWRPTYVRAQAQRLRDYASPVVGKLPMRDVTVEHVTAVLDKVWSRHPNTAALLRAQLEQVFNFAKIKGHREGENPARWEDHLKHVFGKTAKLRAAKRKAAGKSEHHAAMDYRKVAAFVGELRALPDDVVATALEFTILTAARTGEVVRATWDEIDLDDRTWTVPAAHMGKNGKEQRVPLSDRAVAILKTMAAIRIDDQVFPGLLSQSMLRLLQKKHSALTVHGFRSSFRDWVGETTAFPREIAEKALAHLVGDETERAYARGDLFERRRKLMDAWMSYCARPAGAGKVVLLGNTKKAAR